jgi:ABC-type branched-subunit amino acid transport system substrate-binding protein
VPAPQFWPAYVLIGGSIALLVVLALAVWLGWRAGLVPVVRGVLVAGCLVLAAGAVGVIGWAAGLPDYCQSGNERLVEEDGQCVGISDGGYVFDERLAAVSHRIERLNDRVTEGGTPYATIALMIPMTPDEESEAERAQLLREVQGAYLAQYQANVVREEDVPVRLVLANPGRDLGHGRRVADWLGEMARSPEDRLRVVFGFNLSVRANADTIGYLTREKHIPVVGGPITATGLANDADGRYPGLVKVVPSNLDQANALRSYLGEDAAKTFLIQDRSSTDLYSESLRQAFGAVTRGSASDPQEYDPTQVTKNDFAMMVNNLCDSEATTIYFAGRPPALALLINALGERGCHQRHFRVVTVSGASTIALEPDLDWGALTRGKGLTVEYATITHPDAWAAPKKAGDPRPPATGGSPDALAALNDLLEANPPSRIGPTDLSDGRTITMYDSALTAVTGIVKRGAPKGEVPTLSGIEETWRRLRGAHSVKGASGWICLDNNGTPYDKAVAIVRLVPSGGDSAGGHLDFRGIAWPTGKPLTAKRCADIRG